MNLPNKITMVRVVLAICTIVLLIMPWYQLGIQFPMFTIAGKVVVDTKFLVAGFLFLLASVTDFVDGYLARSTNHVTDFGKVMDAIADKVLVNGVLIILAYQGFVNLLVPVIIVTRDIVVDSVKMACGNKGKVVGASFFGKMKTVCMLIGISLLLFYNLPFELLHIPVADLFLLTACILSVLSGCQYYFGAREFIFETK